MPQPVLQNTSCRGKRQLILKYSGIYNFVQSYLFLYLAMMKHLYYILMFTFLCLGLTTISQEEQPDSRNTTGSPAGIVVGSPASECSFTAYTQCASYTATHRSLFNVCWNSDRRFALDRHVSSRSALSADCFPDVVYRSRHRMCSTMSGRYL